ncbi:MAG TPA: hypothetical protein VGO02_08725 [Burkholderiales bacterium]|nr:hypothetical protein [Burkholderiales bacterium]
MNRIRSWRRLLAIGIALCVSGCAAVRSYDHELGGTLDRAALGNVDGAIKLLDDANADKRNLLYQLELGMLQRLGSRYDESQKAWTSASAAIEGSRSAGVLDLAKMAGGAASYVLSDKLRPYEAHDYEQVMLLTYMALNHLAMGDYDGARVAIKQTHELEAEVAERRARQLAAVEEEAKKRGARSSFKDLNGYPVATIDNPAVNALRNGYQSALSHYLAGFIYEALGEPSLAAPGYRLANELQPDQPLLEEALAGLDARTAAPDDGMTDVLLIVGSGSAPALQSRQFTTPILINNKLIFIPAAYPVMTPVEAARPLQLVVDGRALPLAPLTSIDLMARRSLQDDMPSIMLRATIRSTTSAVLQYQAQNQRGDRDGAGVALAAGLLAIGAVMLNSADDRTWRALPSDVAIARTRLPPGQHKVLLQTLEGEQAVPIGVSGRHAVVDFRLFRRQVFVSAPKAGVAR